jgi:hypothetical protein
MSVAISSGTFNGHCAAFTAAASRLSRSRLDAMGKRRSDAWGTRRRARTHDGMAGRDDEPAIRAFVRAPSQGVRRRGGVAAATASRRTTGRCTTARPRSRQHQALPTVTAARGARQKLIELMEGGSCLPQRPTRLPRSAHSFIDARGGTGSEQATAAATSAQRQGHRRVLRVHVIPRPWIRDASPTSGDRMFRRSSTTSRRNSHGSRVRSIVNAIAVSVPLGAGS